MLEVIPCGVASENTRPDSSQRGRHCVLSKQFLLQYHQEKRNCFVNLLKKSTKTSFMTITRSCLFHLRFADAKVKRFKTLIILVTIKNYLILNISILFKYQNFLFPWIGELRIERAKLSVQLGLKPSTFVFGKPYKITLASVHLQLVRDTCLRSTNKKDKTWSSTHIRYIHKDHPGNIQTQVKHFQYRGNLGQLVLIFIIINKKTIMINIKSIEICIIILITVTSNRSHISPEEQDILERSLRTSSYTCGKIIFGQIYPDLGQIWGKSGIFHTTGEVIFDELASGSPGSCGRHTARNVPSSTE
uniref:Uncharacterized protein n=1 Tax=Timema bartmani TaxID=61472 RepID=A0A7R9ETW9_9NEOP|nr:unnamed protein product [Timema bartmani]